VSIRPETLIARSSAVPTSGVVVRAVAARVVVGTSDAGKGAA